MVLDFTKQKKSFLTVKLDDEDKTVLLIKTPTKVVLDEFIAMNELLSEDEELSDKEALDCLYSVCAKVMSFNKNGKKITSEYLGSLFDIEDIKLFFKSYSEFISTLTNAKN